MHPSARLLVTLSSAVLLLSGCSGTTSQANDAGSPLDATVPSDGPSGGDSSFDSQREADSPGPLDALSESEGAVSCPPCGGAPSCDCPCSPPATGSNVGFCNDCNYGGAVPTTASCYDGIWVCNGPACPPPLCTFDAGFPSEFYCCPLTAGVTWTCGGDGGLTCATDGGLLCPRNPSMGCPCGADAAGE